MTLAALGPPARFRPAPAGASWGGEGSFRVVAWEDPVVDRNGFSPRSPYVERWWLPVLGPSATLLVRRMADLLLAHPGGIDVDAGHTARALGLGGSGGRHAPFPRALRRCVRYGLARPVGTLPPTTDRGPVPVVAFRRMVAPVPARLLAGLPRPVGAPPDVGGTPPAAEVDDSGGYERHRQRALTVALEMAPAAADTGSLEDYLQRIGTHPTLAFAAAAWAGTALGDAQPSG